MVYDGLNKRQEDLVGKEQRVRELADNLLRRGLAMTKDSAKSLAESMVATEVRIQRKYEEQKARATFDRNAPSYNELASRQPRFYNKVDEPASRGEPVALEGTPVGKSIGALDEEFRLAEEAAMRKAANEAFVQRATHPEPLHVETRYETPLADAGVPEQWVELAAPATATEATGTEPVAEPATAEHYPELTPEMLVSEAVEENEVPVSEVFTPVVEPETAEPVAGEQYPELTPELMRTAHEQALELDVTQADEPLVPDFSDAEEPEETETIPSDDTMQASSEDNLSTGADDPVGVDEPFEVAPQPAAATPQPEEKPAEPAKENLAKKHGVDLSDIFNVNK
jgi:hypothetical protein